MTQQFNGYAHTLSNYFNSYITTEPCKGFHQRWTSKTFARFLIL